MKNKILILVALAGLGGGILLTRMSFSDDTDLFLASAQLVPPNVVLLLGNTLSMKDLPCGRFTEDTGCAIAVNGSSYFVDLAGQSGFTNTGAYGCSTGGSGADCFDTSNFASNGNGYYATGHVFSEPTGSGSTGSFGWTDVGDRSSFCAATTNPAECTYDLQTYGYYITTGVPGYTCSIVAGDTSTCSTTSQCRSPGYCNKIDSSGAPCDKKYTCDVLPSTRCFNNLSDCENGCVQYGTCTYHSAGEVPIIVFSGDLLNFYPPKFAVARRVFRELFVQARQDPSLNARMGFYFLKGDSAWSNGNMDLHPPCNALTSTTARASTIGNSGIYSTDVDLPDLGAPLGTALMDVGLYYANDRVNSTVDYYKSLMTGDGCTPPQADNAVSGYLAAVNPGIAPGSCDAEADSVCGKDQLKCQGSYVIVISDGNINRDTAVPPCIRNYTGGTLPPDSDASYIDEVAAWLYTRDVRHDGPDASSCQLDCMQNPHTFTIGFGNVNAGRLQTASLFNAATNGGGGYAPASNYSQLIQTLKMFIRGMVSKSRTFSAPVLPTVSTSAQFDSYITSFVPAFNTFEGNLSTFWEGHLRAYGVQILTGGVQFYDACGNPFTGGIIVSTSNAQCGGQSVTETIATPFWDAGGCLSDTTLSSSKTISCSSGGSYAQPACYVPPDSRNIYTMRSSDLGSVCTPAGDTGNTWLPSGTTCGSAINNPASMTAFTTTNISDSDLGTGASFPTLNDVIAFIRGPKVDNKPIVLGDIFHSEPQIVNPPGEFIPYTGLPGYEGYADWARATGVYDRTRILVAGANDGMLHAFNAGSFTCPSSCSDENDKKWCLANPGECFDHGNGKELWAYVPNVLLPKLKYILTPPTSTTDGLTNGVYFTNTHIYFVDGSPMVRDVKLPGVSNGISGLSGDALYWHTVLICGLRLGGTRYFALDITNPLTPKFMWEFTDPYYMAFTWSQYNPNPSSMGPVWVLDSSGVPQSVWATWLNGGLNVDLSTGLPEYSSSETKGRGVFVLDISTGTKLWQFVHGDAGPDTTGYMNYSFPASVAGFDQDLDLHMDKLYVGDMGGQMWRFDLSPKNAGGKIVSGLVTHDCTTNPGACWTGQPVFQAPVEAVSPQYHNIYYIPATGFDPAGNNRVLFGTGDRMNPNIKPPAGIYDRFYAVKGARAIATNPMHESDLTDVTNVANAILGNGIGQNGWYVRLGPDLDPGNPPLGVKVLAPSNLMGGAALWTAYEPNQSTAVACGISSGEGLLYAADYLTGGTFITAPGAMPLAGGRAVLLGAGIPSAPVATFLISGGQVLGKLVGSTSDASLTSFSFTQTKLRTRIIYWLEVPRSLHDLIH